MILTFLCCESFYLYQQDKNEWNVEKEPSYVTGATLNSYELKNVGHSPIRKGSHVMERNTEKGDMWIDM